MFRVQGKSKPILRKQQLPKHTKTKYDDVIFNSYDSQCGISNILVKKFEKNFYSNSKFDPNDYKKQNSSTK